MKSAHGKIHYLLRLILCYLSFCSAYHLRIESKSIRLRISPQCRALKSQKSSCRPLMSIPEAKVSSEVKTSNNMPISVEESNQISVDSYAVIALLFFVTAICSLDRVAMSVAIIPMSLELGYDEVVKGTISSMFSFGYLFGLIPAGILGSFSSPKVILAIGVLLWSAAQALSPSAAHLSLVALYFGRFCMGLSEAVTIPTIQNYVSRLIPDSRRSLVLGIILSGLQVGNVGAYLLSPIILDRFNWSGLFVIYGLIGVVWTLLWITVANDSLPQSISSTSSSSSSTSTSSTQSKRTDMSESNFLSIKEKMTAVPWLNIIKSREVQSIAVAHGVQNFGLYINLAWLPTFFNQRFGQSVDDSSFSSLLPWVAGAIVGPLAGVAADRLMNNGVDRTTVRKVAQTVALVLPAAALVRLSTAVDLTSNEAVAYFVMAVASAAVCVAGFGSSVQDICGSSKYISIIYSLTSAPAVLLGSVGVYLTGIILSATQSWELVFQGTAIVYLLGAIFYAVNYQAKVIFD